MNRTAIAIMVLLGSVGAGQGQTTAVEKNLSVALQELVQSSLPTPLFEDDKHWNLQRQVLGGKMRNDGRWWKVRVEPRFPNTTCQVAVVNLRDLGSGKKSFTVQVSMAVKVVLNRQTWLRGVRLYSGETRARTEIALTIDCESESKWERANGALVPDLVVRLRVVRSDFRHGQVIVEHTAGVGGDAARTIGDVLLAVMKQVKPSLERKLIDKANAAVLKAGNNKEVRLSLSKLVEGR